MSRRDASRKIYHAVAGPVSDRWINVRINPVREH